MSSVFVLVLVASWTLPQLFAITTAKQNAAACTQQQRRLPDESTGWPSLRFDFKFKRSSISIYGHETFSMYANPSLDANGTSVLYDVSAAFREGSTEYNYTVVNGIALLMTNTVATGLVSSEVNYLSSELDDFPPINAIVSALNNARPLSDSAVIRDNIKCTADMLYAVSVGGFQFALCVTSALGFTMYGRNADIVVEYLENRVSIVPSKMLNDDIHQCAIEMKSSAVTPIGKYLLTGKRLKTKETRNLAAQFSFWFEDETACSCKSTPRPCIFIHGLGVEDETSQNVNSLPYWGNITNHVPCCTTIRYAHLDTVNNSWMNVTQQQKVCDRALAVSKTSKESIINDTILVTHSMGGLMFAGALANGLCALSSSSTWISTATPMQGSMASDYARDTCAGETNFLAEKIAELKKQCPAGTATKSVVYEHGAYSSMHLKAAYKAAQDAYRTNVSALMCSEGFSGILSSYQAQFWVLGHLIPHKSNKNDGVVGFESCTTGFDTSKFDNTYTARFYRTKLNHYDMQFRAGDAFLNKAKMPLKWLECLL
ncbi:unnamed protein product [Phytophthora fragariaefolia]|uniref:Unnamed protein product n=1 Tax=Phytophthora fragariaefolia TaxID=1490495 RepID=A0A9W7CJP8_9STRA|nr:unnamed protein product [Phytophthora fragariaefolia]